MARFVGLIALWAVSLAYAASISQAVDSTWLGYDSHAYWLTGHSVDLYTGTPGEPDAYLYSPLFAFAISPLTELPWAVFGWLWAAIETVALIWLLAPVRLRWAIPIFLLCLQELLIGNVFILLGVMTVLGVRQPTAWALGALTKITPAVGLLWFAARHEWRRFAIGLGVIGVLTALSYAMTPHLWREWADLLLGDTSSSTDGRPGSLIRALCSAALVVFAGRTGRAWLLPVAVLLASPMVGAVAALTVLAAIPRLAGTRHASVGADASPDDEARLKSASIASEGTGTTRAPGQRRS